MKANNLQSVLKNLPEDYKGIKFNEEVSSLEKHIYHVLELNKIHLANEERYEVTARVKKYNENSWNGVKDELRNMGYKIMFILHDPTLKAEEKLSARKKAIQESKGK